jgi:hypothetical protein
MNAQRHSLTIPAVMIGAMLAAALSLRAEAAEPAKVVVLQKVEVTASRGAYAAMAAQPRIVQLPKVTVIGKREPAAQAAAQVAQKDGAPVRF